MSLSIKGVSIPDIFWLEEQEGTSLNYALDNIKKCGFNCVRVPVLPGHFVYYTDYFETKISNIVEKTKELNLMCILDWHAIGQPIKEQTRLQKYFHINKEGEKVFWYNASFEIALKGIEKLTKMFGKEKHLIFELFNEPAPGNRNIEKLNLDALPWNQWKKKLEQLIEVARRNTNNTLIVSPVYWSHDLESVSKDPLEYENIYYSFHAYPLKNNKDWKKQLDSAKNLPIIITEWGYDSENKESIYHGNRKEYGLPFMNYLNEKNISWVAWCFSASFRPRMLKKWKPLELSDFGKLALEYLG